MLHNTQSFSLISTIKQVVKGIRPKLFLRDRFPDIHAVFNVAGDQIIRQHIVQDTMGTALSEKIIHSAPAS